MSIKFEKIQAGMTLWTRERRRMGNTTRSETVAIPHRVLEVQCDRVKVERNGRETVIPRRSAERMSAKDPKCTECRRVGQHKMDCSKGRA